MTYSPYECPGCNPFCGCGSCGECMGAPTPRCWEHEPLGADEVTESRVRSTLEYGHNTLEFDAVCRQLLEDFQNQALGPDAPRFEWWSTQTGLSVDEARAEFVRVWNARNE